MRRYILYILCSFVNKYYKFLNKAFLGKQEKLVDLQDSTTPQTTALFAKVSLHVSSSLECLCFFLLDPVMLHCLNTRFHWAMIQA